MGARFNHFWWGFVSKALRQGMGRMEKMLRSTCWVFVLSLLALACGSPDLDPAAPKLEARPSELEFPRTFVDFHSSLELRIMNAGRVGSDFSAVADEPFLVQPEQKQKIDGTSEKKLVVSFLPTRPGLFRGTVHLMLGDKAVQIPLSGRAEWAPPCVPSNACTEVAFDPVTGSCTETPLREGAPCISDNLCLEETTCRGGACKGGEVDCPSLNACEIGYCDPATGCQRRKLICQESTNPCTTTRCLPDRGCVEENLDGMVCGRNGCDVRDMCFGGTCVEIGEVQDGEPCNHACGKNGSCLAKKCIREEGLVLEPSWSYLDGSSGPKPSLLFPGVASKEGYLFWIECAADWDTNCAIVSRTANNHLRFRAPTSMGDMDFLPAGLLLAGEALVTFGEKGVFAIDLLPGGDDGSKLDRLWSRSLDSILEPTMGPCPCAASITDVIHGGDGKLVLVVQGEGWWGIAGIEIVDGSLSWFHTYDAPNAADAVIADGEGAVFFVIGMESETLLHSRRSDGAVRWEVPVDGGAKLLGAVAGLVFLREDERLIALYSDDGSEAWQRPFRPTDLVASFEQGFAVEDAGAGKRVAAMEWMDGKETGLFDLGPVKSLSPMILMDHKHAAIVTEREGQDAGWWLEGIDPKGESPYRCSIPSSPPDLRAVPGERWTYAPERWTVLPASGGDGPRLILFTDDGNVRSFFAPRVGQTHSGWSAYRGSLYRGGSPR